jgi:hypothetical protein
MEIELNMNRGRQQIRDIAGWLVLVLLVALFLIGFLGKAFTPASNTVLSWSEWQIIKIEKVYEQELSTYQQYVESLSQLINGTPDPVRAQVVSDQILQNTATGLSALERPRLGLQEAARAVRLWAVGAGSMDTAEAALSNAIQLIQAADLIRQKQPKEGINEWR